MKSYIVIFIACFALGAQAQTIEQLKKDMYGIATDATEGRFTGSPGYLKAAHYVEAQLKAAGIRTIFQGVPFLWDNYDQSLLTSNGISFSHKGGNFIVLQYSTRAIHEWVIRKAMPDSAEIAGLTKQGAGLILLPNERQAADWETTVIRQYRFGYMHYAADRPVPAAQLTILLISPAIARGIGGGTKLSIDIHYKKEGIIGYNLIAEIAGTDKRYKDQTIIAGAHLDHIGRLGAHIYNGANDDASGCAALMTAARWIARHPGKRPVMFVFYCGEELNLQGSRYFMEHPPVPLNNIRMNINLEQLGSRHRSFQGVWALGDTVFQRSFFDSGSPFAAGDLKFSPTDSVTEVLSNTDSYSFMKKKIPSILLGSGGFDEHHTTQDNIDLIDFEHLRRASVLLCSFIEKQAF